MLAYRYFIFVILLWMACQNRQVTGTKFFEEVIETPDGTFKKVSYFKALDKARLLFVVEEFQNSNKDTVYFNDKTIHSDKAGWYLYEHYCKSNAVGDGYIISHNARTLSKDSFYLFLHHKVDSGLGSQIERSDAATIWYYLRGMRH